MTDEHTPPLGFHALTPLYDRVVALTLPESELRDDLIAQVARTAGTCVVDLGCGTGAMALRLAETLPDVAITGLDPDEAALEIARRKAGERGLRVRWLHGLPWDADIQSGSVDAVVSCLVLHHLNADDKRRALESARRWLVPGGHLHIADWGAAQGPLMRAAFLPVQWLDGFETTTENVKVGLIPAIRDAGFVDPTETRRRRSPLGVLSLYHARAPRT